MAYMLSDLTKNMPKPLHQDHNGNFRWRAFKCPRLFICCHPDFNWKCYINKSFDRAMKPMYDRMQRVV